MAGLESHDSHPGQWIETEEPEEWDDFVAKNRGSIFHSWSWRKVLEGRKLKPRYLAFRTPKGETIAVCPFFYKQGRHLQYLDSLPHTSTAGPLLLEGATDPTSLLSALRRSAKSSPFKPIAAMMIRSHRNEVVEPMVRLGMDYRARHGLFVLDLHEKTPQHVWNSGFNKHDRQAVKYYDERARFQFGASEKEYLELERPDWGLWRWRPLPYYPNMLQVMRKELCGSMEIALATDSSGVPMAGFLMLTDPPGSSNSSVHLLAVRYAAARNIHSPVTFVNWKAVNWANEHGFRFVDFGPFSIAKSSDEKNKAFALKRRFELSVAKRYEFTIPTSISYSIGRRLKRVL